MVTATGASWKKRLVILACLFVVGTLLAHLANTSLGSVQVSEVTFDSNGTPISALLYRHKKVTAAQPASAVVLQHGYTNSKETVANFAIELARRGIVALCVDNVGHGKSGGNLADSTKIRFGDGLGGIAAVSYLRSLDFVDPQRIGHVGHSLGCYGGLVIAAKDPALRAIAFVGGRQGANEKVSTKWPRNMLVTAAKTEEVFFVGQDVSKILMRTFGAQSPVENGKLYGSFKDGTARMLVQVPGIHPIEPALPGIVRATTDWMHQALDYGKTNALWFPTSNLIYVWKELGNLIALVALALMVFPAMDALLSLPFFAGVKAPPAENTTPSPMLSKIGIATAILAAILFVPCIIVGKFWIGFPGIKPWMRALMYWLLANAVIQLALYLIWYRKEGESYSANDRGISFARDKFKIDWVSLGKSFLLGLIIFAGMYVVVAIVGMLLHLDYRNPLYSITYFSRMPHNGWQCFLLYILPFSLYFLMDAISQKVGVEETSTLRAVLIKVVPFMVVLVLQYGPLLVANKLILPDLVPNMEPAYWPMTFTIIVMRLITLVPVFTFTTAVTNVVLKKTGRVWVSALLNGALVVWFLSTSQPTGPLFLRAIRYK